MTEELDKRIREIANKYVSECWGTYLDLSETDLVQAGIGVALEATKELSNKLSTAEKLISMYKEQLDKNPCVVTPDWHCSDCLKENEKLKKQNNELQEENKQAKKIIKELSKYVSDSKWYSQNDQTRIQSKLVTKAEAFINKGDNCPDVFCDDCTKADCNIRKLGLVPNKE